MRLAQFLEKFSAAGSVSPQNAGYTLNPFIDV